MNISVFCSRKFLKPLRIMLFSLLKYNSFEAHNIYIVNSELTDKDIKKLNKEMCRKFGQKVISLKINEKDKELFNGKSRFREAAFYKLYMFNRLDESIDRIMCLDADMVINGSLKELYYQELGDNTIAACKEKDEFYDLEHIQEIGLTEEDTYYNAGVLVIDLKKYLKKHSPEEYAEWYNNHIKEAKYVAQDILNVMYRNDIKPCDTYTYNNQIFFTDKFTKHEYEKMKKDVVVFHYVGAIKPDEYRCETTCRELYIRVVKENKMWLYYITIFVDRFIKRNLTRIKRILFKRI